MKSLFRLAILSLIAGVGLSASSMVFEYEYCMDGPGRGLPLAVIHPSHGEVDWVIPLYDTKQLKWGPETDVLNAAGDLVFWVILFFCAASLLHRWRRRSIARKAECANNAG